MPTFTPAKGALVRVDDSASALSSIVFQYNPATLRHTLRAGALSLAQAASSVPPSSSGTTPTPGGSLPPGFPTGGGVLPNPAAGIGGGLLSGIASLFGLVAPKKPAPLVPQPATVIETIQFTLVLDCADAMQGSQEPMASLGLHPILAALERLLREDARPMTHGATVFVWGANRSLPVRLVDLDMHEELFGGSLNPLHARVEVALQALDGTEPGAGQTSAALFAQHQKELAALAQVLLNSSPS